jgi:hypothetical protein
MREELGRRPGRGRRRTEVDLDGSVLRRASLISKRLRWGPTFTSETTHLPTRSDVFTRQPDIRRPSDVSHPIAVRVQGRLDFRAPVQVPKNVARGLARRFRITQNVAD